MEDSEMYRKEFAPAVGMLRELATNPMAKTSRSELLRLVEDLGRCEVRGKENHRTENVKSGFGFIKQDPKRKSEAGEQKSRSEQKGSMFAQMEVKAGAQKKSVSSFAFLNGGGNNKQPAKKEEKNSLMEQLEGIHIQTQESRATTLLDLCFEERLSAEGKPAERTPATSEADKKVKMMPESVFSGLEKQRERERVLRVENKNDDKYFGFVNDNFGDAQK